MVAVRNPTMCPRLTFTQVYRGAREEIDRRNSNRKGGGYRKVKAIVKGAGTAQGNLQEKEER